MSTAMSNTNQSVSTVRTARKTYDDLCQERTNAKQTALEKKIHSLISKACRRMSRKGVYKMSVREIKRIHGPYLSLPTVTGPDSDGSKRNAESEHLQSGFYFYGNFAEFLKIAKEAGLKLSYRWKYDKRKNKYIVSGFYVHFDR